MLGHQKTTGVKANLRGLSPSPFNYQSGSQLCIYGTSASIFLLEVKSFACSVFVIFRRCNIKSKISKNPRFVQYIYIYVYVDMYIHRKNPKSLGPIFCLLK